MAAYEGLKNKVRWALAGATALYVASGLGITESQRVSTMTFGLFTKPLAFQVHAWLLWPFLALLAAHIYLATKKGL
ncbi:MAG: cytochrome b/b6 domain-containing protein [Candidatus Micrarchaeota archaeon]